MGLKKRGCCDAEWFNLAYISGHYLLLPGKVINPMF